MRIAIFHDFFDNIGGGEKFVVELARGLNADIITNNLNYETVEKLDCKDIKIVNLGNTFKSPPFKQIHAMIRFFLLDLKEEYDFFIFSGNWANFGAKNNFPNIYYCHTPTRVLYDFYLRHKKVISWYKRPIFPIYATLQRHLDKKNINFIDRILVNSKNVERRVDLYFYSQSIINYPPISTINHYYAKPKNYWLSVNRIYPHKRIEMQLATFKKFKDKALFIVGGIAEGDGAEDYAQHISDIKPANVKLLENVSEENLFKLYSECKGFITTSLDEDFGMAAVEAMASGKPVIAPNEGGYKETIINGVTGKLIDNINPDKLAKAIIEIDSELKKNPLKYKNACIKQAKKFDTKIFIKKMKEEINKVIEEYEKKK